MTNRFRLLDGGVTAILIRRAGSMQTVLIDTADLAIAQSVPSRWCLVWHVRGHREYVGATDAEGKQVWLGRMILGAGPEEVGYRNHNATDLRRSNLRLATHLESQHRRRGPNRNGSSGFLGVTRSRSGGWVAKLTFLGKRVYVGAFSTKRAAAAAVESKRAELLEVARREAGTPAT